MVFKNLLVGLGLLLVSDSWAQRPAAVSSSNASGLSTVSSGSSTLPLDAYAVIDLGEGVIPKFLNNKGEYVISDGVDDIIVTGSGNSIYLPPGFEVQMLSHDGMIEARDPAIFSTKLGVFSDTALVSFYDPPGDSQYLSDPGIDCQYSFFQDYGWREYQLDAYNNLLRSEWSYEDGNNSVNWYQKIRETLQVRTISGRQNSRAGLINSFEYEFSDNFVCAEPYPYIFSEVAIGEELLSVKRNLKSGYMFFQTRDNDTGKITIRDNFGYNTYVGNDFSKLGEVNLQRVVLYPQDKLVDMRLFGGGLVHYDDRSSLTINYRITSSDMGDFVLIGADRLGFRVLNNRTFVPPNQRFRPDVRKSVGQFRNAYEFVDVNDLIPADKNGIWSVTQIIDYNDDLTLLCRATYQPTDGLGQPTGPIENHAILLVAQSVIIPDYNRDGKIDYADRNRVSEAEPFRFWINDDDDSGEYDKDDVPQQGYKSDSQNSQVDGMRDLVDFFPLFFDLESLLSQFGDLSVVDLRLSGSSVNFLQYPSGFVGIDPANADSHHRDVSLSNQTNGVLQDAVTVAVSGDVNNPSSLGSDFVELAAQGKGVLLLEGVGVSPVDDSLVLHVYVNGTELSKYDFPIELSGVEDMYHHVNITDKPTAYDLTPLPPFDAGKGTSQNAPNWPDYLTNGKTFVFLHGYRVDGTEARGWNSETFKRLHQLGSNARFVGVTWHGATGLDYHKAVFQAFQTGEVVTEELRAYANTDLTVAAHSLGNMVISHAIQSHDFFPQRYYMINAAVPVEAYSFLAIESDMVESDWTDEFASGQVRLFASNWHELFAATPSDQRNRLKWKDMFEAVVEITELYNFYSAGEDVLTKQVGKNSATALGQLMSNGFNLGRGAWKTQELVKGKDFSDSLISLGFDSARRQSGWNRNVSAYLFTDPITITDPELMTVPYFDAFNEVALTDDDAVVASAEAEKDTVLYDLLARGIPALSYAAAVEEILASAQGSSAVTNFDLETSGRPDGTNIWPSEGHGGEGAGDWLHSDFRNVALPYVFPVYEEMIDNGALNESN